MSAKLKVLNIGCFDQVPSNTNFVDNDINTIYSFFEGFSPDVDILTKYLRYTQKLDNKGIIKNLIADFFVKEIEWYLFIFTGHGKKWKTPIGGYQYYFKVNGIGKTEGFYISLDEIINCFNWNKKGKNIVIILNSCNGVADLETEFVTNNVKHNLRFESNQLMSIQNLKDTPSALPLLQIKVPNEIKDVTYKNLIIFSVSAKEATPEFDDKYTYFGSYVNGLKSYYSYLSIGKLYVLCYHYLVFSDTDYQPEIVFYSTSGIESHTFLNTIISFPDYSRRKDLLFKVLFSLKNIFSKFID